MYIVCGLLSVAFHTTSLIIIILFYISESVKLKKESIALLSLIGVFTMIGYQYVSEFLIELFPVFDRFLHYTEGREFSLPFFLTSVLYILVLITFSWKLCDKIPLNRSERKRLNLVLFSIPVAICSLQYVVLVRLCLFAFMQLTILLPKFITLFQIKNRRANISIYLIMLICFFIMTTFVSGNNRYYSYSTYFNAEPTEEWYR